MPLAAANLDSVTLLPFSSVTAMPFINSPCLINGMLTQLAAATAANGTYLCEKKINEIRQKVYSHFQSEEKKLNRAGKN